MYRIDENELILLLDSWLNYQILLRVFYEEETFEEAERKILLANGGGESTVECAEQMLQYYDKE